MTNILEYIDDLEKGKATAERIFRQRKAIWERAVAANGKAQMFETSWKDFCGQNEAISKSALSIYDALFRSAKYGNDIVQKTKHANDAVEWLSYDVRDIACQAEYVSQLMTDFEESVKRVLDKGSKAEKCMEGFSKTLPDVSKFALEALDGVLELVKSTSWVDESIGGNCGINARLVSLMATIDTSGLLNKHDHTKEETEQIAKLNTAYTCNIAQAETITDLACGGAYAEYIKQQGPSCMQTDETDFCEYAHKAETNLKNAEAKLGYARKWLNCTAQEKNEAEADYNSCKAAYELAKEALKC